MARPYQCYVVWAGDRKVESYDYFFNALERAHDLRSFSPSYVDIVIKTMRNGQTECVRTRVVGVPAPHKPNAIRRLVHRLEFKAHSIADTYEGWADVEVRANAVLKAARRRKFWLYDRQPRQEKKAQKPNRK